MGGFITKDSSTQNDKKQTYNSFASSFTEELRALFQASLFFKEN